jgi:hypothetical protein
MLKDSKFSFNLEHEIQNSENFTINTLSPFSNKYKNYLEKEG